MPTLGAVALTLSPTTRHLSPARLVMSSDRSDVLTPPAGNMAFPRLASAGRNNPAEPQGRRKGRGIYIASRPLGHRAHLCLVW